MSSNFQELNQCSSVEAVFEPASFRIGTVQFLNAVPLTWKLENIAKTLNAEIQLVPDTPANLADDLVQGKYDAAMIPVAEAVRHPELTQISDVCIASEGAVKSIKFIAMRPLEEIRRVGLDPASRTSNALLQICLEERSKRFCEYTPFHVGNSLGIDPSEAESLRLTEEPLAEKLAEICRKEEIDGVLLIGDKALFAPHRSRYFACVYDMGLVWTQWTGLPFMYASWFARPGADMERLSILFNESRRASQIEMDVLTLYEGLKRQMPIKECHDYLTRRIRYRLGGRERRGAEVFCKMMQKCNLAPLGSDLKFSANRRTIEEN